MNRSISTLVREVPPEVEASAQGLGTLRSSGTYIALLLNLEAPEMRADILTYAAKELGLTLEDLTDSYNDRACEKCGVSIVSHKQNGGRCF